MTWANRRRYATWFAAGLVALVLLRASDARADGGDAASRALIQSLMSPYCPGLLLSDCRSEGARQLRVEIEQRMASGETADDVQSELVRRFGPEIRTMPEFEGVGRLAWVGPPFFGLAGLFLVVMAIRASTRRHAASRESTRDVGEDVQLAGRLQDELSALD
jgi:cytochrome c-type biogenesis protein CcmH/NrfF